MPAETFDTKDLAVFLEQDEELTKRKSQSTAGDLMAEIIDKLPKLTFICKSCNKSRGMCRCPSHGYRNQASPEGWKYRALVGPWKCTVASLMSLREPDIKVLGSKSYRRIKRFVRSIQRQE